MLKIRSICLVNDDEGFERTKELLMQLGATHVLRDNSKVRRLADYSTCTPPSAASSPPPRRTPPRLPPDRTA